MSPAKQRGEYASNWPEISANTKDAAGWACVRCRTAHNPSSGHTLTVHHFDGDRCNNEPWNLMALCQRCHLRIQAKVDPQVPLLMLPSDWILPYLAGFYEAGQGIPGPGYDLEKWINRYPGEWPAWAPSQKEA